MQQTAYDRYIATSNPAPANVTHTPGHAFSGNVLINAKNLQVSDHLRNLYAHLLENHYIDCIVGYDINILSIFSRDVLQRIKAGDPTWERMVPEPVVEAIKKRRLFGYGATPASAPASPSGATAATPPPAAAFAK